jgi:Rad3-related DNA helicase
VNTREIGALSAAYRTLFQASAGGGLGLFTAIARLRAVHARIAAPLEEAGIPLQCYLRGGSSREATWGEINSCYRSSLSQCSR